MLSQLGHILVGVIDSMMVGQLGPEPLELRILPIAFSMSSSCLALAFLLALPLWWLRPMARLAN